MPNTAASCCSSSSGNGASAPRATVCSDTVVNAPARAPTEIHPAIFSLWLIKNPSPLGAENIHPRKPCDANVTSRFLGGFAAIVEKSLGLPALYGQVNPGQPTGRV